MLCLSSCRVTFVLAGCLALAAVPIGAQSPLPERVVRVRCDNGASLQNRIDNFADEAARGNRRFVFEIHGFCEERVEIRYPLTLRGVDQLNSGITGPADLERQVGLVQIINVLGAPLAAPRTVQIDNLTIKESPQSGLLIVNSEVGLDDLVIRDHGQDGVSVTSAGFVLGNRLTISDNTANGINSRVASRMFCTDCVLTGNAPSGNGAAATATVAGVVSLTNATIDGVNGLRATGGEITQSGGTVTATAKAGQAARDGHLVYQNNVQATGDVWCEFGSTVTLQGPHGSNAFTQSATSATGGNSFSSGCMVSVVLVHATFAGTTQVAQRAHLAVIPNGSATLGTLNCFTGGTAAAGFGAGFTVNGVAGVPTACNP